MTKQELRELEHDKFVDTMGDTLSYAQRNSQNLFRIGGVIVALLVVAGGVLWYMDGQRVKRQSALQAALTTQAAPVGEAQPFSQTFQTEADKAAAAKKAFAAVTSQYAGSNEAAVANYYLGVLAADEGKLAEAKVALDKAIASSNEDTVSIAKLTKADVLVAEGKSADAEQLLQQLVDKPSALVSKEQATLSLARVIARRDLPKAKSMLEPLRTKSPAISRSAIAVLGEITNYGK